MKTEITLEELLKQITPLPWNDRVKTFAVIERGSSDPSRDIFEETAALNKAYLTHCANVLPELVEALRLLHDYQNGCPLPKYEKHWNRGMELSEAALARAEKVKLP